MDGPKDRQHKNLLVEEIRACAKSSSKRISETEGQIEQHDTSVVVHGKSSSTTKIKIYAMKITTDPYRALTHHKSS